MATLRYMVKRLPFPEANIAPKRKLDGGFKYLLFSPLFGEGFQFDEHIFQMGWFNHQLEKVLKDEFLFGKTPNIGDILVFKGLWMRTMKICTLPETNSLSLKIGRAPKGNLVFQPFIFRCKLLLVSGECFRHHKSYAVDINFQRFKRCA